MQDQIQQDYIQEEEIDLVEIAAKLWARRRFIIKTTLIFLAIGIFTAISNPPQYTATTIMVPQTGDRRAGGELSGLAAMAGIKLGSMSSGEALSPYVYPQVLKNINLRRDLLYSKFNFRKADEPISYYEYKTDERYRSFSLLGFIRRYTLGLPGVIISAMKGSSEGEITGDSIPNDIQTLTPAENSAVSSLFAGLSIDINDKDRYISLSFTSEEPQLSAEVVLTAQKLLQKYITEFKLQKVESNLMFIDASYAEAKRNFEEKQAELAGFRDRNKSLFSAMARTQEEKLTSEYNLLLNIYTELAKQREQAKIAVTETTPILTVIKPATIPAAKSGPNTAIIILGFIFSGLIAGGGWVLMKPVLIDFKEKFNTKLS